MNEGTSLAGLITAAVVGAVLLLVLMLFASPIIHPFVYAVYAHWPIVLLLIAGAAGVLFMYLAEQTRSPSLGATGLLLCVAAGIPLIAYAVFGGMWQKQSYLENTEIASLEAQPDTTGVRYLPYEIAQTVGPNMSGDPTVNPGEFEPLVEGSEASWIAPREPNGFLNSLGPQKGVITASDTSEVEVDDSESFAPGVGTCCITNTLGWQAVKTKFWADYSPEPYVTVLAGETVIVRPYLGRYFDFPTMVPYHAGSLVFRSDGTVEDLTVDEASEKYPDGRFAPHEMATYFSDAYQLKDGIWNYLFRHVDQPDVPELSGENQFPFLTPTTDGPVWYTAVEPYGTARSVYKSYYVDATSGEIGVYDFPEALVGPDRAASFVNAEYQELKNAVFIEPRSIVVAGSLYWLLTSTTSEYSTISFTALVDARTEDVYRLEDEAAVEDFVESGELPGGTQEPTDEAGDEPTGDSDGPTDAEIIEMLREAADRLEAR